MYVPNLIQLEECHEGHESIAYAGQGCPLCAALSKLYEREQELTEVYKLLEQNGISEPVEMPEANNPFPGFIQYEMVGKE